MKTIISASRRTDIPHYYSRWFANRLNDGMVEFRNCFGGKGRASLKPEDVAGFLFWTKYAKPFHGILETLRSEARPYAFQYTITGTGGSAFEPNIPVPEKAIDDFFAIRRDLPSSRCIQWRYDPIILTDDLDASYHMRKFAEIAKALEGATTVVNVSFIEPYAKALRRLKGHPSVRFRQIDPERHKTAARRRDQILQITPNEGQQILKNLADCAGAHGMQLRACCNPEFGTPPSQCVGNEMFADCGQSVADDLSHLMPSPSRTGCRCLQVVDIGMDNTCIGGCPYCYVVTSQKSAMRNIKAHDPAETMIRPNPPKPNPPMKTPIQDTDQSIKQLAQAIAVAAVRNTCLEDLHAGRIPDSEVGDYSDVKVVSPYGEIPWNELPRIDDNEMKRLMRQVVIGAEGEPTSPPLPQGSSEIPL